MNKAQIIQEIQRTATANGGAPLGARRFAAETGIREADWQGKLWARWNDALREAGFGPNQLQAAYDKTGLLEKYAALAKELGQLPTANDLRLRDSVDPEYPNPKVFERFGTKAELVQAVLKFCHSRNGYDDVMQMCSAYAARNSRSSNPTAQPDAGFVYLIKSGRFHKIGKSNAVGRREYELAIQLPERATTVHTIQTDDPNGIEAYWHRRFEAKRKNGEWFELDSRDIAAFKRRKFM